MRKWLLGSILTGMVVLALWGIIRAQTTARQAEAAKAKTAAPTPDLSGVWHSKGGPASFGSIAKELPLQPWAQARCKVIGCGQGVNSANEPSGDVYDLTADPSVMKCAPEGFPRALFGDQNKSRFEIFQIPDRVFMRFERYNSLRQIWADGRGHPEEPDAPWMGHSIGKWDGNTFVVDTVGFNDKTWLDDAGYPHTEALHVVERIQRTSPSTLQIDLTFEDPGAYTEPFSGRLLYELSPGEEIPEVITCEDRILADNPEDAWPFFIGPYPKPPVPPVGSTQ